ncbi:protein-arginine deiminase type-2 isoform X1 [Paramormyrops kingsleyae]|uniref:protein-arginine deiminase type-2 isoform X1 n=1 Tax=Paramormyrops kingsleyae TaxID=1676925 RepID=UPI003B96FADB
MQRIQKEVVIPPQIKPKAPVSDLNLPQRTLQLEGGRVCNALFVLGTQLKVNLSRSAPPGAKSFSVQCSPTVQYKIEPRPSDGSLPTQPLVKMSTLLFTMDTVSKQANESKLSVRYYGEKTEVLATAIVHLTAIGISLDVDADRDGVVEKNNPNKGSWKWGPKGHGAILLVNCDSESVYNKQLDLEREEVTKVSDLKDMSRMILRTSGPDQLPKGYKLVMHINKSDSERIRVFRRQGGTSQSFFNNLLKNFIREFPVVLSHDVLSREVPYKGTGELDFYVEGLRFPDRDFDGLVTVSLSLLEPCSQDFPETPIFTDKVVFRVAPWIMTPNTLKPVEVFVCSVKDNNKFLRSFKDLVARSACKMTVCYEYMNRGDRWMQDEVEFGYIDSPHQRFPVVLDSPRDRELQDFPYNVLLGPDFGYVTREPQDEEVSSLDSFGNLEVSPPVTVNGKSYPLGRIIIGVAFPTTDHGRNMTRVVQDFLWAQKVQEPIALYSDWLIVGHVDEFMTFVPAPDRKGFRLLLASPDAAYKLFRGLQKNGFGKAKQFDGLELAEPILVDDLLSDETFRDENRYVQGCIDWNRDVLKRELGLEEEDIIDLPILFKVSEREMRAAAFYPDMVNMIVLGKNLGIPKPFGPKVNGQCVLEAKMRSLLEPLGLNCIFVDDFATYHLKLGEVHCGSNVRREPFEFKWWNMEH